MARLMVTFSNAIEPFSTLQDGRVGRFSDGANAIGNVGGMTHRQMFGEPVVGDGCSRSKEKCQELLFGRELPHPRQVLSGEAQGLEPSLQESCCFREIVARRAPPWYRARPCFEMVSSTC